MDPNYCVAKVTCSRFMGPNFCVDSHTSPSNLCLRRNEWAGNNHAHQNTTYALNVPLDCITTQALAKGKPKEWERRINLILYPRTEFVNRTLPIQYPCYEKTRLSDYSFFHDGAACFGTSEYHTSWAKREPFRHFDVATKSYSPHFNRQNSRQCIE